MSNNIPEINTEYDFSPATKFDVDMMITERILQFHDALISRGQIKPIASESAEWANHPKAAEKAVNEVSV